MNDNTIKKIQRHEIITYPEHFDDLDQLRSTLDLYKQIKRYAFILHDRDLDENGNLKKPHIHVLLDFSPQTAPVDWSASLLKVGVNNVNRVKNWNAAYSYLTHKNDLNKFQYDKSLIVSNYDHLDPVSTVTLDDLLLRISSGDLKPYQFSDEIDPLMFVYNRKKLEDAYHYYIRKVRNDMTRSVEVIFITGGTQSGKTTFAKWLCRSMNYSYAISSGFNDPLQDYEGQDCLILDDIRDNTFRYDELLKITDNHTNSSVRSRYSNKLFVGRMIIITSTKDLQNWYVEYRNNNKDDINQLITRINAYIHMNEQFIFNYENDEIVRVAKGQQVTIPPERIYENSVRKFYAERFKQSPSVRNLLDQLANNSFDIVQALKQDPDFKG